MKHIRPHKVLDLVPEDERIFHIYVHPTGPKLLETAIKISLLKYVKPAKYFEFGTFLGVTTLNMAMNMHEWGGRIITLDLDEPAFQQADIATPDIPIAERHLRNTSKLTFIGTPYEKQITCLWGDSNVYDLSRFYGKIEMVYIDGGHDLKTLHSDTENALKMLPEHGLSCIVWHDYQNPNYKVTQYLDDLSTTLDLYHIEETMTVFYLKNAHEEVIAKFV